MFVVVPDESAVGDEVASWYERQRASWGYLPNYAQAFATQVARDASSVTAGDVQQLRDHGLTDPEIVDVVLAAAARAFFTKVLDALGVQADAQLGDTFDSEVRKQVTVGRAIATS